jgi:septum formation topological specificity factor MinE
MIANWSKDQIDRYALDEKAFKAVPNTFDFLQKDVMPIFNKFLNTDEDATFSTEEYQVKQFFMNNVFSSQLLLVMSNS